VLNELPVYQQIEQNMRDAITEGAWPVHSKLPDEITLAQQMGVSRGTLRKAIKTLALQGLLTQIKGKGTFVLNNQIEQPLASRLISFSESMKEQSMDFRTELLQLNWQQPDRKVAAFLEITTQDQVAYLERVRLVDHRPVIYLRNYVVESIAHGIFGEDLTERTLFDIIEQKLSVPLEWGRRYFKAVSATQEIAFNLGVPLGYPVMHLEQIIYAKGNSPIEYSNIWINSDRFEISSILSRR